MEKNNFGKMDKTERAKQFMPFDALKGLHEALAVKEFVHEKTQKNELLEEDAERISGVLLALKNRDVVSAEYFSDGHNYSCSGKVKLNLAEHYIEIDNKKIFLEELIDIKKI